MSLAICMPDAEKSLELPLALVYRAVACFVPMASMFGYATDLRSRTRGRATYSMEFDHYAEVPQQIRDDLMSRAAPATA